MRDRKGFTLIELLIVVVIIGILAASAIPKFAATREKAYRSTMLAALRHLASLQELYYSDNYAYSTDKAALGFTQSSGVTVTISDGDSDSWAASASHTGLTGETCTMDHDSPAACAAGSGT